jgi:hypothetical protein
MKLLEEGGFIEKSCKFVLTSPDGWVILLPIGLIGFICILLWG